MTQRRPASMHDVAKLASVSTATVSRVLNTPDLVAPETAARVQRAIAELAYRPNIFAQGLMTRRSRIIGFALPDIHGQFYSEMLRGANAEARRLGHHLLVSSEVDDGDYGLMASEAAGLIGGLAVMVTEPNQALWSRAADASVPVVVIDRDLKAAGVDCVVVDNAIGTREATLHLLESVDPERCYFIGGPRDNYDTAHRAKVFREVLAERTPELDPEQCLFREYSAEWGERAAAEIMRRAGLRAGDGAAGGSGGGGGQDRPIGILAGNDEIAFGAMRAAQGMGISVPWKVRVVGFDDTYLASVVLPRLSSVRVPMAQVGAAAIEMLVRRLNNPEGPSECRRLPTRLIVRESSVPGAMPAK